MQNGSLGRRINIEARAYDDRVEFRYIIPRSTMLDEILIDEELTEFNIVGSARVSEIPLPGFPRMTVQDGVSRLAGDFAGRTPLVCPWRVISPAHLAHATVDHRAVTGHAFGTAPQRRG